MLTHTIQELETDQAQCAWYTPIRETIENQCITFEIYLDAKEKVIVSLYGWGFSITYRLFTRIRSIDFIRIKNKTTVKE